MSEQIHDVRAKVLIAEDDAIVALDLQGMVMRLGYDVVAIVDNGQAAIASAQRFMPDIILLDMVLKGPLDGIEVAKEIQKSFDVPVVFCVSSPDLSSLVRAKEISYAGYLLKPINPDSLATTLDTALYKYKLEKRVEQAEAKFRSLAGKCDILQFFFDRNAAYEWKWENETGVTLDNVHSLDERFLSEIRTRIDLLASSAANDDKMNRLTALIETVDSGGQNHRLAMLGIRTPDTAGYSGMLIPLSGEIA